MEDSSNKASRPVRQIKHRYSFDAMMMFIYMSVVHVWGLWVYPLGRDYALLEAPGKLPFLVGPLFAWETATFGANVVGYHLVNLALLYACMLCIYHFTRFTIKGQAWFGTLAATLFMANPVHSEAVLNLCGVADLLPCLVALAALTAYTARRAGTAKERVGSVLFALALFMLAVLPYRQNVALILVLVLFEFLVANSGTRRPARLLPFIVVALAGCYLHVGVFRAANIHPARMFAPLYFIFYPIGFLPETAARFHTSPWLGWVAAATVLGVLALVYRKARRPAILFGLLSMAAVRLFQGDRLIDPVHLVGGGQLLLANVLFNIAAAALFHRMMDHVKWRQPVIALTTVLCLVLFGLQIRSNRNWRLAGERVQAFQERVERCANETSDAPIGIVPDYQCYIGAPMCLGEAIRHTTPFSRAVHAASLLPLHYAKSNEINVAVTHWTPKGGIVRVTGKRPVEVVCWPYTFTEEGDVQETEKAVLELRHVEPDAFVISIRPKHGALPAKVMPVDL